MKGKVMDVGLARVSTRDQNPALQLAALEQAGCGHIYEERVSGVSKQRPVRDQVLAELQPGDTLTVWKLDRLGRSTIELLAIINDLERRGIRFRVLTQPIDTSTHLGKFFLTLLAAFAEMEREIMRERVLAGKAQQRADGRPLGPIPFGWTDASTVNQAQAALLREAARRLLNGEPLGRIVDDFNARELRPGKATRWRASHLRRLLLNPSTARLLDNPEDAGRLSNLFHRVPKPSRGWAAEHLLSGILTCGRDGCGEPLYAAQKGTKGQPQMVYRCKRAAGSGGRHAGCGGTVVSLARADDWAREAFVAAVASEDFAASLHQRQVELLASDTSAEQLDAWRQERDELALILPLSIAEDKHRKRHAELERLVRQATASLMAQPHLAQLLDLPKSEAALRAAWASWTTAERRTWLRRVVQAIVVKPAASRSRASSVEDRFDPRWLRTGSTHAG